MAKTYQNIIDEARTLLQDAVAPLRYTDEALLAILNRGLQELGRLRPDAFWDRYNEATSDIQIPEVVVPPIPPAVLPATGEEVALTDTPDFPAQFYGALVYFVTAQAEIIDDEFTNDGRASMLMAQFKQQIVAL